MQTIKRSAPWPVLMFVSVIGSWVLLYLVVVMSIHVMCN